MTINAKLKKNAPASAAALKKVAAAVLANEGRNPHAVEAARDALALAATLDGRGNATLAKRMDEERRALIVQFLGTGLIHENGRDVSRRLRAAIEGEG